jgi:hypothetical protein
VAENFRGRQRSQLTVREFCELMKMLEKLIAHLEEML